MNLYIIIIVISYNISCILGVLYPGVLNILQYILYFRSTVSWSSKYPTISLVF